MKSNAELWACVEGGRKEGKRWDEDEETVKTAQETPDMNHLAQISPGADAVAVAWGGRGSE